MTKQPASSAGPSSGHPPTSLSTAAARNLTTITKSRPQMQGISAQWLLRLLPWVPVSGGVYRVNSRLRYASEQGIVGFTEVGGSLRVISQTLDALPLLYGFAESEVLEQLADRFRQTEYQEGEEIAVAGKAADCVCLLAHGKAEKLRPGKYGDKLGLGLLSDGDHFGDLAVIGLPGSWEYSVRALTRCVVLSLHRHDFRAIVRESRVLQVHLAQFKERLAKPQDKDGQAAIELAAGHKGEPELPTTFVNYHPEPREYELSVAQTILNVHTRVADLYNGPLDQVKEQLRLTIEALHERQEDELLNNPEFGLLQSVDRQQHLSTRAGPPTPDDLDELLCRRRKTQVLLAQPAVISAFGRECSRRRIYPETVSVDGQWAQSWRGVPILPCDKIPVSAARTSSIVALRFGADHQGVVGLRPESLPNEYEPGLNVRFMGINERAIMQYLVSAYYSVAILTPDAVGVLDNVELGR